MGFWDKLIRKKLRLQREFEINNQINRQIDKKIDIDNKREIIIYKPFRKIQNVQDSINYDKICIAFFKQKALNKIYEIVKDTVKENEFQIMYSSLNIKIKDIVYLHYPLVFYSFKQEIYHSHIDYDLKDIFEHELKSEFIEKSKELAKQYNSIINILKTIYNNDIKTSIFLTNSIHRHPGNFGFSSTDLSKDLENPGVIYRNKIANNILQVDNVIYIKEYKNISNNLNNLNNSNNFEVKFCDNLANIVNVKEVNDNIEGTYERLANITLLLKEKKDNKEKIRKRNFENVLGIEINLNTHFDNLKDLLQISLNKLNNKKRKNSVQEIIESYYIYKKYTDFRSYLILIYLMYDFLIKDYTNKIFINLDDFKEKARYYIHYWDNWGGWGW